MSKNANDRLGGAVESIVRRVLQDDCQLRSRMENIARQVYREESTRGPCATGKPEPEATEGRSVEARLYRCAGNVFNAAIPSITCDQLSALGIDHGQSKRVRITVLEDQP